MPIFISYSHDDKYFVDRLAAQLVTHKAKVWLDRWELHVGDSLIHKIEEAIAGSSALLVILSKASVQSEWCRKELSAALIRELEEKRVIVLPVLKEQCTIPLFLRDKLYADFTHSFDDGLKTILESIARVTSNTLGRHEETKYHIDWAIDYGIFENHGCLRLTFVEQAIDQPYSILTIINILGDEVATSHYLDLNARGYREYLNYELISLLHREIYSKGGLTLLLEDEMPKSARGNLICPDPKRIYDVHVTARRLGQDTGRDILLDIAGQIDTVRKTLHEVNRPDSDEWDKKISLTDTVWK